ncbi:MAG: L-fucokinase, partial [Planctomycetota bacterium]
MTAMNEPWDYLIVTASNDLQAAAYRQQLDLRIGLGLLAEARDVLVLPDPGGQRVGSGGSTLYCLLEILRRRLSGPDRIDPQAWLVCLRKLRILIVHAGGDSKRLPAYSPCGKLFVPMPGEGDGVILISLFDRQVPTYFALPPMGPDAGQVVMAAGDALVLFDPQAVTFAPSGLT